ncbi:MAG: hypothetical protein QM820_50610 [Minicystis sp.]
MGSAKTSSSKGKQRAQTSSTELLDRYRADAMKVKPVDVLVCRADPRVAFANVRLGVESVFGPADAPDREERVAAVQEQLPKLDAGKATKLPELARALMLAAQRVVTPTSNHEIESKLAIVGRLRGPILKTAEVLAQKGLLPKEDVARIRAGSGKYDVASDGVALAGLFEAHAAQVKGKHAFTDEDFATMRAEGEWLLDHLTPAGARKAPRVKSDAADLRDRLWTLLVAGHADLRVMGYVLFRDDFDRKVPKLQSQTAAVKSESLLDGTSGGDEHAMQQPEQVQP